MLGIETSRLINRVVYDKNVEIIITVRTRNDSRYSCRNNIVVALGRAKADTDHPVSGKQPRRNGLAAAAECRTNEIASRARRRRNNGAAVLFDVRPP